MRRVGEISALCLFTDVEIIIDAYFHTTESVVEHVTKADIQKVINDDWLGASNICVYLRYLGDVYFSKNPVLAARYSFVSPHLATVYAQCTDNNIVVYHLIRHAREDHLVFFPQNIRLNHWVLVGMIMKSDVLYCMDPPPHLTIQNRNLLKSFFDSLMLQYRTGSGGYSSQQFNKIIWKNIKVPRQTDGSHCGYFYCIYVEDVILSGVIDIPDNFVHTPRLPTYDQERIEEFKIDWTGYLYNRGMR